MEPNHIYQFSLLNALMDGVCETGITAAQLRTQGTQGLGTFARMDGELVLLDNHIYRLRASGPVVEADYEHDQIPFAVVTNFAAQETRHTPLPNKSAIDDILDAFNHHAKNLFMTYRIAGQFQRLTARTVRGQEYRGQPLAALGEKQRVQEFENVRGTIVGFRTPAHWQGLGVAGEHLHFIDDARQRGGHVLDLVSDGDVEMQMAVASNVHVELPTSEDFNAASLVTDDEGVRKVEG